MIDHIFHRKNSPAGVARSRSNTPVRIVIVSLVSLVLLSCAADRLHKEGLSLIDQGQVEEGLAKLEAAVKADPKDFSLRTDLVIKRNQAIQGLLLAAERQRTAGHFDSAAILYQRVLKIDAENPRAQNGLAKIAMNQRHETELSSAQQLFEKGDNDGAQQILRAVLLEDPSQRDAMALKRKIDEQIQKATMRGPSLKPDFKKPVTLEFRDANLKMVVEALSRSSGINILLDKDVRGDLKTTIFVKEASVEDTIDLIALQNDLLEKVLSDDTILLYPNTPAKVKEYQDLLIRTFELTNADAKQMETMLKTLLKAKNLYVDEKSNSLVLRDTPDAIRLAERLIDAHDAPEPEVMLEVEVLEVTRSKLTELGVKFPEQVSVTASGIQPTTTVNTLPGGGVVTTTTPAQPLTLENLKHLSGNDFTVSPLSATLNLKDESGVVNILASPRIRVSNREKAKILIGDRVPVITNAITPVSTGTPVVTGNVQYLDVGLKLNVEPDIHRDDDVAIKINLEVSSIVNQVVSGPTLAYQIGTRSADTVLRLKDGETDVLAGLINDQDRSAAQKFPGLGELPILGRLFSSHKNDANKTEIVLSITPHIVRGMQRPDARDTEFWSGTDDTLRSKPITLQPSRKVSNTAPTPAATAAPAATTAPAVTTEPVTAANSPTTVAMLAPPAAPSGTPLPTAVSGGDPVILSWQGPTQAKAGDEFQLAINAQTAEPLGTVSFTVDYDPKALQILRVDEGDLLRQGGQKTIFTSKIDTNTAHTFVSATRLSPQGVTGKGSIAIVTFKAGSTKAQSPVVISLPTTVTSQGRKLPPAQSSPIVVTIKP